MPELAHNLFSEGTALDKGLTYEADQTECKFSQENTVVATGTRIGKLYKMKIKVTISNAFHETAQMATVMDWHKRLGHQNMKHIRQILKKFDITAKDNKDDFCEGCLQGKQHRLSFPSSSSREVTPGKLLHVDLNGPMEIDSIGGSKYFINFRDDASSYRTVYFMKHKSETKNIIQKHLKLVENDTGNRVGILRSDNGTEFIDKVVKNIIEERGMRHQLLIRQSRMDAQNVTIGLSWKVPEA